MGDERRGQAGQRSRGIDRGIDRLESRRDAKQERRLAGDLRGQRARGRTEKLLTRITSGAVYAISVIGCLYLGTLATAVIVAAMAWLCCSEFFRLTRLGGRMPAEVLGLTGAVAYPLACWLWGDEALAEVTFALLAACAIWYVITPRANLADVAVTAFGPLYTSLALSCLVLIRASDAGNDGAFLTFAVMGSVWINDSAAYFVGSRFGAHKLAPRISPKKSVEGFWGGLAGAMVVWLVMAALHIQGVTLPIALVGGPLVGLISVVGDLFESRVKRGVGVKDSGTIMPGHGGLLDRSDSMVFGCMAAYLVLHLGGIV